MDKNTGLGKMENIMEIIISGERHECEVIERFPNKLMKIKLQQAIPQRTFMVNIVYGIMLHENKFKVTGYDLPKKVRS